ncbi:hypothetical protein AMELA_G00253230 [Ameiurus melas]|uniref:Fibronectin type-III domain-containing protein n=1 Tax=Ameiurus melas TaxID=219545 RepID=A0A7J5ZQK3_AMEME|nr:hypothetical protein AMELA_G00253230 [Ameiurus melas]
MIFGRLVQCLTHSRTDTAMNASFTIGCLCGSEQSRCLILAEAKEQKLVSGLETLLSNDPESEPGQTACFALSCLASKDDGHALLMESPSLPGLLDGLLRLLKSGDPDSTWFAAMTVRVFVSRPNGVTRVREHSALEEQLKCLSVSPSTGSELQEELSACLRKLKRLPKPSPVNVQHQSMVCIASWERLEPESGLEVTYNLFDGDTPMYRGPRCQITLPHSHFQHKLSLSLRLNLCTSDGDTSPFSEHVEVRVEGVELRPRPPKDLRFISCTATEVRLKWAGPEGDIKPLSFQVYCDDVLLETTRELGATVSSLSPDTTYTISICALGPGHTSSSRCSSLIHTADGQEHAPSGLVVSVLGCHKLQIIWDAPAVPIGRLFSYELRLNGFVVYLGKERMHKACHLTTNTPYICTVTAITSRGRYQSRAVTKRTTTDEYLNTNRGFYSPKRQDLAPLPARQKREVKNRTRKLLSTPTSDSALRKNKHRLPSVMVQSHVPGKNKSSRVTSEEKSVGLVSELDATVQLSNTKGSSDVGMVPSERLIMQRRDCNEHTLRSSLHPIHPRPKINPDCRAEKATSDKGRLPLINQQINHHHNIHRKRLVMGSRVNSRRKGGL